ncbi:unnamed protein product [Callosobruchus maculatus]|uniref:Lysophospholipid acyltransferase 7 n=1 Tax=Callosobruchus maculatus TaxID=64391 RepID=A0A653CF73_CALMS|nr:unnamed protein product [Callosobruchus maculatus]
MNADDIIYLGVLAFCMCFGLYYRKINDPKTKKHLGAIVGLLVVFCVSGVHIIHALISATVSALLIVYTNSRTCPRYVFTFAFLYLCFFRTSEYFGIPYGSGHTNLVLMMVTLKTVGLAFEVSRSHELKQNKGKPDDPQKTETEKLEEERSEIDQLDVIDVLCYVFCFCGVLTGPYFRYRVYIDHLEQQYHKYDDLKEALIAKVAWLPVLLGLYVFTEYYWPIDYVNTDEFLNRSFFYRYWYIWPTFVIFRSRIYAGLVLTEMVCIFAGLGLYPSRTEPKAGYGPTKNLDKLKECTSKDLETEVYDYQTIRCIDVLGSELAPTSREAMKNWNITVQYWLAAYVYKQFPIKKYRTAATMLTSAIWHGVYPGYFLCIGTVPITLMFFEDIWVKILITDKSKRFTNGKLAMLFLKTQLFSYQIMSFVLLVLPKIFHYYNSVYHCVVIFHVILYFVGKRILKKRRTEVAPKAD